MVHVENRRDAQSKVRSSLGTGTIEAVSCHLARGVLRAVYAFLKALPTKSGKMVFLSRQSDAPSLDARMLFDEVRRRDPSVEVVCVCKRIRPGVREKALFAVCLVKSLYHLATSQVCVLDSYWPAVSALKHKSSLKVVQMWHALGKIKQSGWQTVGLPGGRSETVARIMRMHAGYHCVIAGGAAWNPFYCASFNIDERIIRNVGLPRIDYLLKERNAIKARVYENHPLLNSKPVVLYAPTFRRSGSDRGEGVRALLERLDFDKYAVVVKAHPNQRLHTEGFPIISCSDTATLDLLAVADYLITDYSAIAIEAAALNVKTFYYVFDYEDYQKTNGLNIDLRCEMPGCVFDSAEGVVAALEQAYPWGSLDAYRRKFLFENLGNSTRSIVDILFDEAGLSCSR